MRAALLILPVLALSALYACVKNQPAALSSLNMTTEATRNSTARAKVDFDTQVKPILQQRCQPCHFSGGVMYQRLPFDRAQTITTLGTKLFTRLKDEKEQRVIREFLEQ